MFLSIYIVYDGYKSVSAGIELKTMCIECQESHSPLVSKSDIMLDNRKLERWHINLPQELLDCCVTEFIQKIKRIKWEMKDIDILNNILMHEFFRFIPETNDSMDGYEMSEFSPDVLRDYMISRPDLFIPEC